MNLWVWLTDSFIALQEAMFALAAPVLFSLGMGNLLEDAYAASAWLLAGVLQILVILLIFGPFSFCSALCSTMHSGSCAWLV